MSFSKVLCSVICALCVIRLFAADAAWEAKRKAALDRPRKIIYNTDGCDVTYYPADKEVSRENFINLRLRFTENTAVDTISYCVHSVTGMVLFDSKEGTPITASAPPNPKAHWRYRNSRNPMTEFIKMGTDPFRIAVEYAKKHDKEIFASLRMNDNHDVGKPLGQNGFLNSDFRIKHPETLLGSFNAPPKFGFWSQVDYGQKIIRDKMKAIIAELCANYDLDGIELDFMRHMSLLKSVAQGNQPSAQDFEILTGFIRDVRAITEAAGKKRGRPILLIVRLPDSLEYCRALGIDLEAWMKYIDIYIGSSYFQLKQWQDSVALAKKHGVKFYASLDESRIPHKAIKHIPGRSSGSRDFMLARTAAAMAAGCDGIYHFNLEYESLQRITKTPVDELDFANKVYFATERGGGGYRPRHYVANGDSFCKTPRIDPRENPPRLTANKALSFELMVADDLNSAEAKKHSGRAYIQLLADASPSTEFTVTVNGTVLEFSKRQEENFFFNVPAAALKKGLNKISVSSNENLILRDFALYVKYSAPVPEELNKAANGSFQPIAEVRVKDGKPAITGKWQNRYGSKYLQIVDGKAMRLIHGGENNSPFFTMTDMDLLNNPPRFFIVRWRSRVLENAENDHGFMFSVGPARGTGGVWEEILRFSKSEMKTLRGTIKMDFSKFHDFCLIIDTVKGDIAIFIDGKAVSYGVVSAGSSRTRSFFYFGDGSKASISGKAEVEYVSVGTVAKDRELDKYAAAPVSEKMSLRVKDNAPVISGRLVNKYLPDLCNVMSGKYLQLIHDSGKGRDVSYMHFSSADNDFMNNPPEWTVIEWNSRVYAENTPSFLVSFAPARPDGGAWETLLIFSDNSLNFNGVEIPGNFCEFHKFRLIQNTRNGKYALWMDGQMIRSGVNTNGKHRKASFIHFGDASGRVAGKADLEYAVIGSLENQ